MPNYLVLPDVPRTQDYSMFKFLQRLKRIHANMAGKNEKGDTVVTLQTLLDLGLITKDTFDGFSNI